MSNKHFPKFKPVKSSPQTPLSKSLGAMTRAINDNHQNVKSLQSIISLLLDTLMEKGIISHDDLSNTMALAKYRQKTYQIAHEMLADKPLEENNAREMAGKENVQWEDVEKAVAEIKLSHQKKKETQ